MDQPSSRTILPSSSSKDQTRSQIIGSFWIVIILSLPVWWNTTKIERQTLPRSEVEAWDALKSCPIRFPIKLTSNSPEITSVSMQSQVQSLASRLESGRNQYHDSIDILTARCFDFHVDSSPHSGSGNRVILHRSPSDIQNHTRNFAFQKDIEITLTTSDKPKELLRFIAPLSSSSSSTQATDSRVIKYSSQLKLVFSLLNEDCTQSGFIRSWSIKHAIELYLEDLLASFAPLHNLTCQTQILQHSPLAFEPTVVANGDHTTYVVEQEELKAFINDADWNLASSVTMEPVVNFVLWVPSPNHRPFKIRRTDGTFDSDGSFIRPQWGSVVIYNPDEKSMSSDGVPRLGVTELARPMQIFRHHLLSLLGLVDNLETPEQRALALDAIVRRRIVENSLEAINSMQVIVKLVDDQTNMRVSMEVQNQVKGALASLKSAQEELMKAEGSLWKAALHADESKTLSSTAFFSPTMLSLLYFPDEHKYAIYTPLFGPVLVPLVIALIKELKSRRKKKSLKEKEE
ncbi:GPI transamidase component [Puccinia graminis f. sp. tritici]|uniref:GPI transamidase component n=1 Tax=Puccinia graminis f. sp. tritici TaxID=56615 RepID=A0A5B0N3Q8_PUCGR|nr:GPI transamidase component [Puccinia graminis f. sp. tritici]KAA1094295.1 GPI transamidase component [Puccinia graminis f. sp. tritici]